MKSNKGGAWMISVSGAAAACCKYREGSESASLESGGRTVYALLHWVRPYGRCRQPTVSFVKWQLVMRVVHVSLTNLGWGKPMNLSDTESVSK